MTCLAASILAAGPILGGCGDAGPADSDESDLVAGGLALTKIKSASQYDSIAFEDGGVILPGKSVKFLIDNRTPASKKIFFMNAQFELPDGSTPDAARFHYPFAQKVLKNFADSLGEFNDSTYSTQDKKYFAGSSPPIRTSSARSTSPSSTSSPSSSTSPGRPCRTRPPARRSRSARCARRRRRRRA